MVKKQLQLLNKFQMLDIFNHYYRTCFVANPANKNALMAPWMSLLQTGPAAAGGTAGN